MRLRSLSLTMLRSSVLLLCGPVRCDVGLLMVVIIGVVVHVGQLLRLVGGDQRVDQRVEIATQDTRQVVKRYVDSVIGDAVLREIIGANLLAAVARLHLRATGRAQLGVAFLLLEIPQAR